MLATSLFGPRWRKRSRGPDIRRARTPDTVHILSTSSEVVIDNDLTALDVNAAKDVGGDQHAVFPSL